jgi:hypothetical protein
MGPMGLRRPTRAVRWQVQLVRPLQRIVSRNRISERWYRRRSGQALGAVVAIAARFLRVGQILLVGLSCTAIHTVA